MRLLAACTISGGVRLFDCSGAEPSSLHSWSKHNESCTGLAFTSQGDRLFSASSDGSIRGYDTQSGKATWRVKGGHDCAIERIITHGEGNLATGDENGLIKSWDHRSKAAVRSFEGHMDFISDMVYHDQEDCLVAVSGDGILSVNELKSGKVRARSEDGEEMTALVILKSGKKVVCGTQTGMLNIYSWEHITELSDRMPGHPTCVDAIQKLDDDTILTASSDGIVRVVSIQPHALLGVLAQQEEGGCERISLSHDCQMMATTSYDAVKLWDTSCLDLDEDSKADSLSEQDSSGNEVCQSKKRKTISPAQRKGKKAKAAPFNGKANFFQGLL